MNSTMTIDKKITEEKDFIELKNLQMEDFDMLQDLLKFESISKREEKVANYVKKKLIELGFSVNKDSMGNIFASRGISHNYPLLNCHLDIVELLKRFGSSFDKSSGKTKEEKYGSYKSLIFDNYGYTNYLNNEIQEIKAKKSSEQNTVSINLDDLSDEEAISTWEADKSEIKLMYGEDFKAIGFKCANCVNSCKAFKLCYYFEPNSDIKTKKIYLKSKKELEAVNKENESLKENNSPDDVDFIQESFDLGDKIVKLNKVNTVSNEPKLKNQKYIIKMDLINDKISGSGKHRVLGGDDKCGIFIALKVAEMLRDTPMKILFTVQEETGCNGVKFFVKNNSKWLEDVKYSITIDRRDYCHLLWSQRGTRSCSDNFAAELMYQGIRAGIPVKLEDGGSADVVTLRNYVPNSVNISAGYYKAHTADEYIVPSEVDKIVGWVKNIVKYI